MSLATQLAELQKQAKGRKPSILEFNQEVDPKLIKLMGEYSEATKDLLEFSMINPTNSADLKDPYIAAYKATTGKKKGQKPSVPKFQKPVEQCRRVILLEEPILRLLRRASCLAVTGENERLIKDHFVNNIHRDLAMVDFAKSTATGQNRTRKRLVEGLYGVLDDDLLEAAAKRWEELVRIARNPGERLPAKLTSEQIAILDNTMEDAEDLAKAFAWDCAQYDFPGGVDIRIIDTLTRFNEEARPQTLDSFVRIPKSYRRSRTKNLQTRRHEMIHLWITFNLFYLTGDSGGRKGEHSEALTTGKEYEFMREYFGVTRTTEEKCYYVFAVEEALNHGDFSKVYETVLGYMLEANEPNAYADAWVSAERTLRGMADFANNNVGYAHTKALSYFSGQLLYQEFKEAGVLYFLEAGLSDPNMMLELAKRYDWHDGKGILTYTDIPKGADKSPVEQYLYEVLLPRLEESRK